MADPTESSPVPRPKMRALFIGLLLAMLLAAHDSTIVAMMLGMLLTSIGAGQIISRYDRRTRRVHAQVNSITTRAGHRGFICQARETSL